MTRFLASLVLLTVVFPALAQERHFLYIQADNEQAFYLKVAGETRSSTPAGYMILPRLADSTLEFVVGFPMRKFPEYSFRVDGIDKDRGYALKDFGTKGWGLFDMQSMEVSMGKPITKGDPVVKSAPIVAVRDSFATILASVVGDSAVLNASLIVKRSEVEPKPAITATAGADSGKSASAIPTPTPVRGLDSARAIPPAGRIMPPVPSRPPSTDSASEAAKAGIPKAPVPAEKPSPKKIDSVGTVRMTLPETLPDRVRTSTKDSLSASTPNAAATTLRQDSAAFTRNVKPAPADTSAAMRVQTAKAPDAPPKPLFVAETKRLLEFSDSSGWQIVFSDRDERGGLDTVSVWIPSGRYATAGDAGNGSLRPERTDCQGMVSVSELGQLRRRMEAIPDEDAKVAAALREFRLRCFTTEQVRSLLVVFFREEGRFKLLDAAFPRIFDPQTFLSLESVLKDPYFIHRFRKLVGLQ